MPTVAVLGQTLKNLLEAFVAESNACARYAAFAIKADEEGYLKVGGLFRAACRAEQIHAANHAQVIENLGGNPAATMEEPEAKTTLENLQAAIAQELYETDVMYPDFINEAEAQMNEAARRAFKYAIEAEKKHASLFTEALEQIRHCVEDPRQNKAIHYVCPECGFIADKTDFDRCPTCDHSKKEFKVIN
jgi:rubrerythrin